jgi:hypothetical protein
MADAMKDGLIKKEKITQKTPVQETSNQRPKPATAEADADGRPGKFKFKQ